ncbi:MAG TPA: HNH endonuclease [Candidatus Saccharimonadales bacterium]|nr:HNH endonuclease [Candidatus Saccharimonadales bacterium]
MNKKQASEQLVRQRARFQCENCKDFTETQFAHIIPESNGGIYEVNNLLFFCLECHRKFEPTRVSGKLRKAHIKRMKKIKNHPKIDSFVTGIFDELQGDKKIIVRMGGITFINTKRLFEENPSHYFLPSYLEVLFSEDTLQINGLLKDENQKPLIIFSGSKFSLFTGDFWDVIRKPSYLEIVNTSKKVNLILKQNDDLSINLQGNLYLGKSPVLISIDQLILAKFSTMRGCIIENGNIGLSIG